MGSPWLEIRSNAPGLPGPILLEHQNPYTTLPDRHGIILVLGSASSKRQFLMEVSSIRRQPGIFLERLGETTFVADCTLHEQRMLRVRGGPSAENITPFCLSRVNLPSDPASLPWKMYAQLLSPFSTVVLLFADDFGGLQEVADMLATMWICASRKPTVRPPPRLVLASHQMCSPKQFEDLLITEILRRLRLTSSARLTRLEASQACRSCFDEVFVIALSPELSLSDWLVDQSMAVVNARRAVRHTFTGAQFRLIFRAALHQFVNGEPFCLLREYIKLPDTFEEHLSEFCQAAASQKLSPAAVIASRFASRFIQEGAPRENAKP